MFHAAIHETAVAFYTPAQCEAWSPMPWPEMFQDREASGRTVWVAEDAGEVTGFIEVWPSGYIDCFYCHPRGAGPELYKTLEAHARAEKMPGLFAEVSLSAQSFFEKQGFELYGKQQTRRGEQTLNNALMIKRF